MIEIDRDIVREVTIDGEQVKEITIDGEVIYRLPNLVVASSGSGLFGEPNSGATCKINPLTGAIEWTNTRKDDYPHYSVASDTSGNVYIGNYNYNEIWKVNSNNNQQWSRSSVGGRAQKLFISSDENYLYSLAGGKAHKYQASNGNHIWSSQAEVGIGIDGGAIDGDDNTYFFSNESNLFKVNSNGQTVWSLSPGTDNLFDSVIIDKNDSYVVVSDLDGYVKMYDSNKDPVWSSRVYARIYDMVYAEGSYIYGFKMNGEGCRISKYSGNYTDIDFMPDSAHVITATYGSDGYIYVGDNEYRVMKLEPNSSLDIIMTANLPLQFARQINCT